MPDKSDLMSVMHSAELTLNDPYATRGEATDLHWLVLLRWSILVLALGAALGAQVLVGVELPLFPILLTLAILAGLNAATWLRLKHGGPVQSWELLLHLLVDLAGLTALLHFSGGWSNPFVFILLLPLAIAAAEGSTQRVMWVLLAAIAAYSFLALNADPALHHGSEAGSLIPVWGMWSCYVLSAGFISFFVLKSSRALRTKERALAQARERELRDRHLVELATMATGAAHELGTPLGTMAIVLGELQERHKGRPEMFRELALLREQVYRCKEILSRLAGAAGERRADAGTGQRVDAYLQALTSAWHQEHPHIRFIYRYDGELPGPRVLVDETLTQTLLNLLNNAAKVSPEDVQLIARCSAQEFEVKIEDRGPGIPQNLLGELGRRPIPSRPDHDGLGIGVYLASATLERLGGRLTLTNRPEGGARCKMWLPLSAIRLDIATRRN